MARSNIQERLRRVRPPRVYIEYDVPDGDGSRRSSLPFAVAVLAPLLGSRVPSEPLSQRRFRAVHRDNFDQVLQTCAPEAEVAVPHFRSGSASAATSRARLTFRSLFDFQPDRIAMQVDHL